MDQVTLLLKIVFHKCYVNKYNLYNQVGLIAINCMGEMYGANPGMPILTMNNSMSQAGLGEMGQRSVSARAPQFDLNSSIGPSGPNIEEELSIDKSTLDTLK